jgi:hypothetical protein
MILGDADRKGLRGEQQFARMQGEKRDGRAHSAAAVMLADKDQPGGSTQRRIVWKHMFGKVDNDVNLFELGFGSRCKRGDAG